MRRNRGFTLTEILVVIAIIAVLAGSSVSILSAFMRNQALRQAGGFLETQFMRARQASTSERAVHFLVLDAGRNSVNLWTDADGDRAFDPASDRPAGAEDLLPKHVRFAPALGGSLFNNSGLAVLTFYPDGSCVLPGPKTVFAPDLGAGSADLVLEQENQTQRLFVDLSPGTGKVCKQALRSN